MLCGYAGYEPADRAKVTARLRRIADNLRHSRKMDVSRVQFIPRARIPILKIWTRSRVCVDVSISDDSGPRAARYMAQQARQYAPLRPIVLVLKAYLKSQVGGAQGAQGEGGLFVEGRRAQLTPCTSGPATRLMLLTRYHPHIRAAVTGGMQGCIVLAASSTRGCVGKQSALSLACQRPPACLLSLAPGAVWRCSA